MTGGALGEPAIPGGQRRRRRRITLAKVAAVVGIAAGVVTVWAFVRPEPKSYRDEVAEIAQPWKDANGSLSDELRVLRPGDEVGSAQDRLRKVDTAAANVAREMERLQPGNDREQGLERDVETALGHQRTYSAAVRATLERRPSQKQQDRLGRYSQNLRTAMARLERVLAGAEDSIAGARRLALWYRGGPTGGGGGGTAGGGTGGGGEGGGGGGGTPGGGTGGGGGGGGDDPPTISDVFAGAVPSSGTVTCPTTVQFSGRISVSEGTGAVTYRWARSDGTASAASTVTFDAPGSQDVTGTTWQGGATGEAFEGQVLLDLLDPTAPDSLPAEFSLICE